ncbi:MAG: ADP-ribosylglycohydrolase family protein [Saprospiraceae bacterium]
MLGAIAGDIIGSVFERHPHKDTQFPLFCPHSRFTDDTVLTIAIADALLNHLPFEDTIRKYALAYPTAGYGSFFKKWAAGILNEPYQSWGNGSAMRVSPAGFAFDEMDDVLDVAKQTALPTHGHPEGIKGAQAVAAAIFLARNGFGKPVIKDQIERTFGYDLSTPLNVIRPSYQFDVSCQGSVPQSICSFLESDNWESAVRNAVSLGGDADTMACIAGGIAEAYYGGVPVEVELEVMKRIPDDFKAIISQFYTRFPWQD